MPDFSSVLPLLPPLTHVGGIDRWSFWTKASETLRRPVTRAHPTPAQ